MFLLAILALALVGATVVLLTWATVLPRLQADGRLGQIRAYGLTAAAGPDAADVEAPTPILDGLARRLGAVAGRAAGARQEELRNELMAAGLYRLTPSALLGYRVIAAVAGSALIVMAAADTWPLPLRVGAAAFGVAAGWMVPLLLVRSRARRRLEEVDYTLPSMIDLLVVTVEAGLGFSSALQLAASKLQGPLGDELRLTLQEQRMGLATKPALKNMAARCDTPAMRTFVRAIVQGEELGVSIGQILRSLSVDMRKLRRAKAEERAHKAPVKMVFPLVLLMFPAIFILLLGPALLDLLSAIGDLGAR